jgi:hypothetical protein
LTFFTKPPSGEDVVRARQRQGERLWLLDCHTLI